MIGDCQENKYEKGKVQGLGFEWIQMLRGISQKRVKAIIGLN
jgi:hypothetical protein